MVLDSFCQNFQVGIVAQDLYCIGKSDQLLSAVFFVVVPCQPASSCTIACAGPVSLLLLPVLFEGNLIGFFSAQVVHHTRLHSLFFPQFSSGGWKSPSSS